MTEAAQRGSKSSIPASSPNIDSGYESRTASQDAEWKTPGGSKEYDRSDISWDPVMDYIRHLDRTSELQENQSEIQSEIELVKEKCDSNSGELKDVKKSIDNIESIHRSLSPLLVGSLVAIFGIYFSYTVDNIGILVGSVGLLFVTLYIAWSESRSDG